MLEVNNLVKKYGDKVAVKDLSFHVDRGEIVGLLGLNGAGKSTTMNCITGYIAPTQGQVLVDGYDILKEPDQAKKVIGYLPEVFSFYSDMKVYEYLNFICDLKGYTGNKKERRKHIEAVCAQTGIGELTGRMIRNLSKGYKQRVGFAQALIGSPKVLILDEPTVGLDPSQVIGIRQLIRDAGRESTVIVSSHILSEIQAICSRIIVIHNGKLAADGTPEQLLANAAGGHVLTIAAKGCAQEIEPVLHRILGLKQFHALSSAEEGIMEYRIVGDGSCDLRESAFQAFVSSGIPLLKLNREQVTLEQLFLQITGDGSSLPSSDHDLRSRKDILDTNTDTLETSVTSASAGLFSTEDCEQRCQPAAHTQMHHTEGLQKEDEA